MKNTLIIIFVSVLMLSIFFVAGCNNDLVLNNGNNLLREEGIDNRCTVPVTVFARIGGYLDIRPEVFATVRLFDPNNRFLGETVTDVNGYAGGAIDCEGQIGYYSVSVVSSDGQRYGITYFYYDGNPSQSFFVTVYTQPFDEK